MASKLRPYTIVPQDLYIPREADRQLENSIRDMGRPPYILVARQMGKTNLLINAKRNLPKGDDVFVYIDMSNSFSTSRECFRNIIDRTIDTGGGQLDHLTSEISKNRNNNLSAHTEHSRELRLCLRAIKGKIVIILDEIDALTKSTYSDEIFSQIRSIYFERINFSEYERLTYVLSGVAEPSEIIKNAKISPFNIGQKIFLNDFSLEEFSTFLRKADISVEHELIEYIYNWTMGNPRMTWEICSKIEEYVETNIHLTKEAVDDVINDVYLTSFDRPPVDHIRDLVFKDVSIRNAIIEIKYGKGDQISDTIRRKLYLSGIINSASLSGTAVLKNRIIEFALSDKWLKDITNQTKDFLTHGNNAFDKANYSEALINYREYLTNNPTDIPEIFNWKFAICCLRANQYQESIKYFDLFEINKSQFEDIYYQKTHMKGLCYAYLNLPSESEEEFNKVVNSQRINYQFFDSKLSLIHIETIKNKEYDPLILKDQAIGLLDEYEKFKDSLTGPQYNDLLFSTHFIIANFYKEKDLLDDGKSHINKSLQYAPPEIHPKFLLWLYSVQQTEENIRTVIDFIIEKQLKPYQFDALNPHAFTTTVLYAIVVEAYKKSAFEYTRLCNYIIAEIYAEGLNEFTFAYHLAVYINQFLIAEKPTAINILEGIMHSTYVKSDQAFQFNVVRQLSISHQKVTTYDRMYLNEVRKNPTLITDIHDLMIFAKSILSLIRSDLHAKALPIVDLALSNSDKFNQYDFNLTILHYYRLLIYKKLNNKVESINSANKVLSLLSQNAEQKNILAERDFQLVQNEALDTINKNTIQTLVKKTKFSRNDKVKVKYQDGKIIEGKYKKFEQDVNSGSCTIIEDK